MPEEKIAIVTGASSGIGAAIAKELLKRKITVLNVSRHPSGEKDVIDFIVDLRRIDQIVNLRKEFEKRWHHLDYLINNAGIMSLKDWQELTIDDYHTVMNTNLRAVYCMCKEFISLLERGEGKVINVASVSGILASPDDIVYGMTKAGVISLTKSLAMKYVGKVSVNCISPGYVGGTNLVGGPTPKELIDRIPIKREASPEEIAKIIVDVLHWTKYFTGANIIVDGGLTYKE